MKKELFDEINDAIKDRNAWALRQQVFYTARNGPHASPKQYPGDPNPHYPLGDGLIAKKKPLYIQQMYSAETIASFVSLKQQEEDVTSQAGYWFDYQLKQRSNFERTMCVAVDEMLQDGFTPIKVRWDADCKRLAFDQVDPLHVIVPGATEEFNQNGGCDWLVHILHMSEAQYRANPNFKQEDDFVKSIKGKGRDSDESGDSLKRSYVELKEGINCSANKNEIVLWEVYNRDRKSKKITLETISPLLPCNDEDDSNAVRNQFGLPYNKGCFKGGQTFPFFKVRAEIKGKGHYSPRGLMEINLPFEQVISKSWKTQLRWQDFFTNPQYKNSGTNPIPNVANQKTGPGSVLQTGLDAVAQPPMPDSLREMMEFARAVAEDQTQIPNFSASEHLTGTVPKSQTATGLNLIASQSSQGSEMGARVFRLDMGEGLDIAWSILLQYAVISQDQTSLQYIVDNEIRTLDQAAIHEQYDIVPNGSADSWNKGALVQKRAALYQMLWENPYIDKAELTKWFLEADDSRNVKRFFRDPGIETNDQAEEQGLECLLMQEGFAPQVHESDDDKAHLTVLHQFSNDRLQKGLMTPELAKFALDHGVAHMGQLKAKKDPMLAQIEAKLRPTAEILTMFAAQLQQNVIPMQQPAGNTPGVTQDGPISPTGPAGAATPQPEMSVTN
jgi:hypothetical protein